MTEFNEILKAKAEAVRALADAIAIEYQGSGTAVRFAENWAQAIESMVPLEAILSAAPGKCALCGGDHSTDGSVRPDSTFVFRPSPY